MNFRKILKGLFFIIGGVLLFYYGSAAIVPLIRKHALGNSIIALSVVPSLLLLIYGVYSLLSSSKPLNDKALNKTGILFRLNRPSDSSWSLTTSLPEDREKPEEKS